MDITLCDYITEMSNNNIIRWPTRQSVVVQTNKNKRLGGYGTIFNFRNTLLFVCFHRSCGLMDKVPAS